MSEIPYIGPGGRRGRPKPLLRNLIGDVLRRSRQQQRRTLADVARAARVSVPYLSEVERGRKEASSEVLASICVALRIDLAELLARVGRDLEPTRIDSTRVAPRPSARPSVRRSGDVVLLAA